MFYVETDSQETGTDHIILTLRIEQGQFLQYMASRNQHYPSYIQCNFSWYSIKNPYTPFISPIPEGQSHMITLNEPMVIKLPPKFIRIYRERYKTALVISLLAWLQEEFKQYQMNWRNRATPISTNIAAVDSAK